LPELRHNLPAAAQAIQIAHVFRDEPARHVTETNAELASIASQMAQLGDRAKLLAKEVVPSRMKLRGYDAVLSPLRRVPTDILLEIARHAQPMYPQATRMQAPMSLAQVSSTWRAAILSCSDFWNVLYLQVRKPMQLNRALEQTNVWFGRAKARPLSLFVHFDFEVESTRSPLVTYFKSLTHHTTRIHHLGLGCSEIIDLFPHLQETNTTYPNLKSLDLVCTSQAIFAEATGNILTKLDVFNESPLENVVIRSDLIACAGVDKILPWTRLTHVSVTAWISAEQVIEILKMSPKLNTGDFSIIDDDICLFVRPPDLAVVHKNIEYLRLDFFIKELCPLQFLSILRLPSLKNLVISRNNEGDDDPYVTHRAQHFLDFKTLRCLSFDCIFIEPGSPTADSLIDVLYHTAVLEELILTRVQIVYLAGVLAAMSFTGSSDLLTLLTTLRVGLHTTFGTSEFTDQDVTPLVQMVESRSLPGLPGGCKSLERICISDSNCIVRSDDSPRIQALQELLRPCVAVGLLLEVGRLHTDPPPQVQPFNGWQPSTKRGR